jgi:hypothetical protein
MRKTLALGASLAACLLAGCGAYPSDPEFGGGGPPSSGPSSLPILRPVVSPTPVVTHRAAGPLAWVEDEVAVCVSLVRGIAPEKAVKMLTSGDVRPLAGSAAADDWINTGSDDRYWIAVGQIGGWTFLWEDNGYDGSLPGIARRLSAGTSMVSFYWNVNEVETFTDAVNGRIVRSFDPVLDKRNGGVGKPLPVEASVHWRKTPEVSMVRLQAAVTGQPLANPQWLGRPGVTFWGSHL